MNVKIFGAGSIGNHLAHASRKIGWDVSICDLDPEALKRTRNEIYPVDMVSGMIIYPFTLTLKFLKGDMT